MKTGKRYNKTRFSEMMLGKKQDRATTILPHCGDYIRAGRHQIFIDVVAKSLIEGSHHRLEPCRKPWNSKVYEISSI